MTLQDGVKLKARIWSPQRGGPWPALLMRQPYGRTIASTITYAHPSWWASHGYLVVVQDVRGQGESMGDFIGFKQEASDTTQTQSWVRDLKECNGRLGTYGFSYQGLTQLTAVTGAQPPDCMAPAMTGFNERDHWSCEGGAHWWHLNLAWGIQLAALQAKRKGQESHWHELYQSLNDGSYLLKGKSILEKYDPKGITLKWLNQCPHNDHEWVLHKPLTTWLRQPLLLIGGWWDPHLLGILDMYQESCRCGGSPELHIGPATHLEWWEEVQEIHLRFFNKHLKDKVGSSSGTRKKKYLWNITKKEWKVYNEEAKEEALGISWSLFSTGLACINSSDGKLIPEDTGEGIVQIVHDPWRPVPSTGGHLSPNPGPTDRSNIDNRADVATFTSSPFQKLQQLKGRPSLEIIASSDQESFDLAVGLSVVNKNGNNVKQLSTGVLRIIGKCSTELQLRKVLLQPLLADIRPGEQLRISIAGSAWPAIGINPGDTRFEPGPPGPQCNVTTIQLLLSESKLLFTPLISAQEIH
ncbi:CocE/NonD family hydrolase [Prochlorococcus sp. MIT 1300]|uniref:CocE/NonD family hydrolase n=1 Tax=Prochlorococcus sp. MIT 1300 TaxID=3096218 RepID=UPI002A74BE45|nr:CocE/NonD family hydrolase [Prochlorococcus sp. MIT 1300]